MNHSFLIIFCKYKYSFANVFIKTKTMELFTSLKLSGLFCFLAAFLFSLFLTPTIKRAALSTGIVAIPNKRSSHSKLIPTLGGIAVYMSLAASIIVTHIAFDLKFEETINYFIVATFLIVALGVLDDAVGLEPLPKLIAQSAAALLIIKSLGPDFLNHPVGLLKKEFSLIYGTNELACFLITFSVVIFMNMINMIDGIDGLAASVFLISCIFFSAASIISENSFSCLLSFSGAGAIIPFIYHNTLSKKKMFLGDNGSLLAGCVLAYLSLDFVFNKSINLTTPSNHKHLLLISLFLYPITDFIRVVVLRVLKRRNPLKADNNHIHHNLIGLGLSHTSSTSIIVIYTFYVFIITLTLTNTQTHVPLLFLSLTSMIIAFVPSRLMRRKNAQNKRKQLKTNKQGKHIKRQRG